MVLRADWEAAQVAKKIVKGSKLLEHIKNIILNFFK